MLVAGRLVATVGSEDFGAIGPPLSQWISSNAVT